MLDAEVPDDLPHVRGDRFLLRQALVNLLENAIDFSPRGGVIEVAAARRRRTPVRDACATAARAFRTTPPIACSSASTRCRGPTGGSRSSGLGLPFVAEVAALHGGEASLENRDGGGAVAELSLPAGT